MSHRPPGPGRIYVLGAVGIAGVSVALAVDGLVRGRPDAALFAIMLGALYGGVFVAIRAWAPE